MEILRNKDYHSFTFDTAESYVGQLMIDISHDSTIGMGGFKIAHPGWLTLTPPPVSGLGSVLHDEIMVKQPFHRVFSQASGSTEAFKIGRFPIVDELPKLFEKPTCYTGQAPFYNLHTTSLTINVLPLVLLHSQYHEYDLCKVKQS
jgi:hypothetical protein